MTGLRICVLVHQFPVRSETFIVNHVAEMRARGHAVTVIPLSFGVTGGWSPPAAVAASAAEVIPAPRAPRRTLEWTGLAAVALLAGGSSILYAADRTITSSGGRTRRLLVAERARRQRPFDVVHAQFGTTASSAVGLRRHGLFDAPIVCSIHGQDVNVDRASRGKRLADLGGDLDAVTTGTEFMRGVAEDIGLPPSKLHVWPQGVDVQRPQGTPQQTKEFRVLSVGRLVEFKGVDDSLRVIAAARSRIPNLRYTVIGDGPMADALRALAGNLGVDDITTFAGARDHTDVLAAHESADVFLQMGKTGSDGSVEGQGVAPGEASASGLPCVATRSGGLPEVVIDGGTGIVVDSGDVAAAADALVRLERETGLRDALGENGRRFISQRYSMKASVDRIESIYQQVRSSR